MCGIIACLLGDTNAHCAPLLIDGLTMLQHRGQDAAGIATRRHDGFLALRKVPVDENVLGDISRESKIEVYRSKYLDPNAEPRTTNRSCQDCRAG